VSKYILAVCTGEIRHTTCIEDSIGTGMFGFIDFFIRASFRLQDSLDVFLDTPIVMISPDELLSKIRGTIYYCDNPIFADFSNILFEEGIMFDISTMAIEMEVDASEESISQIMSFLDSSEGNKSVAQISRNLFEHDFELSVSQITNFLYFDVRVEKYEDGTFNTSPRFNFDVVLDEMLIFLESSEFYVRSQDTDAICERLNHYQELVNFQVNIGFDFEKLSMLHKFALADLHDQLVVRGGDGNGRVSLVAKVFGRDDSIDVKDVKIARKGIVIGSIPFDPVREKMIEFDMKYKFKRIVFMLEKSKGEIATRNWRVLRKRKFSVWYELLPGYLEIELKLI
jgi:hypothetical protein